MRRAASLPHDDHRISTWSHIPKVVGSLAGPSMQLCRSSCLRLCAGATGSLLRRLGLLLLEVRLRTAPHHLSLFAPAVPLAASAYRASGLVLWGKADMPRACRGKAIQQSWEAATVRDRLCGSDIEVRKDLPSNPICGDKRSACPKCYHCLSGGQRQRVLLARAL